MEMCSGFWEGKFSRHSPAVHGCYFTHGDEKAFHQQESVGLIHSWDSSQLDLNLQHLECPGKTKSKKEKKQKTLNLHLPLSQHESTKCFKKITL